MLRKDEGDQVMQALNKDLGVNIIRVNAQKRFLDKLKGVTDPEQKRKIIGKEFIEVFNEEAKKLKDVDFLAQGPCSKPSLLGRLRLYAAFRDQQKLQLIDRRLLRARYSALPL